VRLPEYEPCPFQHKLAAMDKLERGDQATSAAARRRDAGTTIPFVLWPCAEHVYPLARRCAILGSGHATRAPPVLLLPCLLPLRADASEEGHASECERVHDALRACGEGGPCA
jgi:hypothetical protein